MFQIFFQTYNTCIVQKKFDWITILHLFQKKKKKI